MIQCDSIMIQFQQGGVQGSSGRSSRAEWQGSREGHGSSVERAWQGSSGRAVVAEQQGSSGRQRGVAGQQCGVGRVAGQQW